MLPETLEDLTQFVLVGKAKLQAYMLKLQTVNRLSVAQEIRDQTLKEAQEVSNAVIAAEQRIGELLLAIPKQSGGDRKSDGFKNRDGSNFEKSKSETIKEMGYSKDEASDYQQMAKHPEVVQKVIDDALEKGEIVTKASVMREIKFYKDRITALESRKPEKVTVEVVPDDYKEARAKAKAYDAETTRLNNKLTDAYKKQRALEDEVKALKEQTAKEQSGNDETTAAIYFAAECANFVRHVGGYVWLSDKLDGLPDRERRGYITAVQTVKDWASLVLENIERSMEDEEDE